MGFIEILLTGVGLSMDAFAVSVCRGLQMRRRVNLKHLFIIAAFFGGFQALMPAIGYLLGSQFKDYIVAIDHWIAFGLLAFIGGKIIYDVICDMREEKGGCDCCGTQVEEERLDVRRIALMAVATSIDALAVGITFAFLEVNLLLAITVIGVTTFALCALGVVVGHKFGSRFKNKASLAGGIVLILIGTKILLEHLGILVL
ncbi:MAG: manganese efflux pump [Ruminococcaceae bacterium]|nr:manganese efflux pump [Oscillospiraceae bacterium]